MFFMKLILLIYKTWMRCCDRNSVAHLKEIKPLLHSKLAILEQSAHFTVTEKTPDFAVDLLGFHKCMDLLEGPEFRL
jgi:hypothetical protein